MILDLAQRMGIDCLQARFALYGMSKYNIYGMPESKKLCERLGYLIAIFKQTLCVYFNQWIDLAAAYLEI